MRHARLVAIVLMCACGGSLILPALLGQVRGAAVLSVMSPRFACDDLLSTIKHSPFPGLATLYALFGADETCLARYTAQEAHRPHALRIYAIDETHRDTGGSWFPGRIWRDYSLEEIEDGVRDGDPLILREFDVQFVAAALVADRVRNPNTLVTLVPFLEHAFAPDVAVALAHRARDLLNRLGFPFAVELNPVYASDSTEPFAEEDHGWAASCDESTRVVSADGYALKDGEAAEYVRRNANCAEVYLWFPEDQGLSVIDDIIVKPPGSPADRTFTFKHADEYIDGFTADDG